MIKDYYDFLIIGSGIAGLSYALKVAEHGQTLILTKKKASESNTNYAQGGIASVMSSTDSFENHLEDTLESGAGLCNREVADFIIREGPACIQELTEIGVAFSRDHKSDGFSLGREGGHSHHRVVHSGDLTGREIERALLTACAEHPRITICSNHIAMDLIVSRHRGEIHCGGVYALNLSGKKRMIIQSSVTLLAAGGACQVYRHTTNPRIATGDGIAMAYRAGAPVANLEFIQFHPTTLSLVGKKTFLISEAVRGEGAVLKTSDGRSFMSDYHRLKELAPRDIVARAIDAELKQSGKDTVFLDLTHLDGNFIKKRFPNIFIYCLEEGIDITRDQIPVVPAAHYVCGGVVATVTGKTEIARLFVCGETACTGMHGANRLASNSLLEAIATAKFAARDSIACFKSNDIIPAQKPEFPFPEKVELPKERVIVSHNRRELKRLMWDGVGIVRSSYRLDDAVNQIELIDKNAERYFYNHPLSYASIELRNMVTVAGLIIKSAVIRKESRGLHYIVDYLSRDDKNWQKDTILRKQGE